MIRSFWEDTLNVLAPRRNGAPLWRIRTSLPLANGYFAQTIDSLRWEMSLRFRILRIISAAGKYQD